MARHLPTDDDLAVGGVFEDGFDRGLDFAGPNQIGGRPGAEKETNCLDKDRLPRSGLTRKNVEARLELDLDRLDHCKVADTKQAQHVDGPSIVSYV
jgi:hypothetical protein